MLRSDEVAVRDAPRWEGEEEWTLTWCATVAAHHASAQAGVNSKLQIQGDGGAQKKSGEEGTVCTVDYVISFRIMQLHICHLLFWRFGDLGISDIK